MLSTTFGTGSRNLAATNEGMWAEWAGAGEPLVRKSRTCEAKEKIRGVWLDSQAASADDPG